MHKIKFLLLAVFLVSACSSSKTLVTKTTGSETNGISEISEITVKKEAAKNWHLESISSSDYFGIEANRAYSELLVNKTPSKKVVVAIIDSGTDIYHEDLAANIWVNEGEIPGNGIDDDGNGYVDDVHGWNFIGGKNGDHLDKDTYEVTRLYVSLSDKFADMDSATISNDDDYALFKKVKDDFEKKRAEATTNFQQLNQVHKMVEWSKMQLQISSLDSLNTNTLEITESDTPELKQAKEILGYYSRLDISESDIEEAVNHYSNEVKYSFNADFDPRYIVGDDYNDLTYRYYGNNDVKGPGSEHGTHVAGIIGAVRNNGIGIDGIADNVALMIIRTVPDGDERDKDVANAVRYAVDNGADIINMSFGKGYSPQEAYVDAAFKHADEQGVLVIHSAGNDGKNNDSTQTYPNKYFLDGTIAKNFITVGASSWSSANDSSLAAPFSNYGSSVDLFAPGVDVYSTYPENEYKSNSGTSMAGPVVAGAAALIMSYYPELTASEVKDILIKSATKIGDIPVLKPGSDEVVPFSTLSATGGIVNVYQALKLAQNK